MRQESALWAQASPGTGSDEEALGLLDESMGLLFGILIGVGMQLCSLELERRRLMGCGPDTGAKTEQLQLGASLLSVWALMGFRRQAAGFGDPCEQTLGSASLTIGLIRLMRLLCPEPESPVQEAVELSEPLD